MDIKISEANQFINLHAHPQDVTASDLGTINSWIAKYPYCQTLNFLLAQATKDSAEAENNLAKAATFASNREVLFQFVNHIEVFESDAVILDDSVNIKNQISEIAEPRNNMGQAFGADLNYYKTDASASENSIEEKVLADEADTEDNSEEALVASESEENIAVEDIAVADEAKIEESIEQEITADEVETVNESEEAVLESESDDAPDVEDISVSDEVKTEESIEEELISEEVDTENENEIAVEDISVSDEAKTEEPIEGAVIAAEVDTENVDAVSESASEVNIDVEDISGSEEGKTEESIEEEVIAEKIETENEDIEHVEVSKPDDAPDVEDISVATEVETEQASKQVITDENVEEVEDISEEFVAESEPEENATVEEIDALEEIETKEPTENEVTADENAVEDVSEEVVAASESEEVTDIEEVETEDLGEENITERQTEIEEPAQVINVAEEINQTDHHAQQPESVEDTSGESNEQTEDPVATSFVQKSDEKDELIFDSPVASDFFAFAKAEKPVLETPSTAEPLKLKAEEKAPVTEKVAQYNDERLPYTFLWWLNKTRKEHASNTQPYVKSTKPAAVATQPQGEPGLNHQIVENIFHLSGPDELTSHKPQSQTVPFDFRKKEFYIVEKFIKEEPQIKPPAANKIDTENKAKKSSEDANQVVSETLAKIYVEQMLYHKALDVYKKLSLKYPEKSAYFASQIKYLELKVN